MPGTETTRKHYERQSARYSRDMTDEEWAIIALLLPGRARLGRCCKFELGKVEVCDVWDAIQYSVVSGCAWSLLPKDFLPVYTVRYYFYRWRDALIDIGRRTIRIVKHCYTAQGFKVLPRR